MGRPLDWSKVPREHLPSGSVEDDKDAYRIDKFLHTTTFTFGKYKGQNVMRIWIKDEKYCRWFYSTIRYIPKDVRALLFLLIETPSGILYTKDKQK